MTALWEAAIWQQGGRWYASLRGFRKALMNDFASAKLTFQLGPPGQATEVSEP